MPGRKQKHNKKKKNQQQQQQPQHHHELNKNAAGELSEEEVGGDNCPYAIDNSSIVGRYMVASRDLRPGELLISERPLAIGPCVSADPVCLGCYQPVQLDESQFRCPQCLWPMCSAECRGYRQPDGHDEHECALLQAENTATALFAEHDKPQSVKNLYALILIVRIMLLREHARDRYERVLQMESHTELRRQNTELWSHYELHVVQRLRNEWHLGDWSALEIHTICGIVDVNCFEIGQKAAKARALYPSAFLLAHDCKPNTSHTDDPQTYAIILRSSCAIEKGVALTLSYAYTLQGTLKRRDFMYAGKLFWCCCERCSDPKELGTDCSALVCDNCAEGSIRSIDPLLQEADWACDKCEKRLGAEQVVKLLDAINLNLESIDVHNIAGLEAFLQRYNRVLRPNHYLLLSAKYSLCQTYGRVEGYLLPMLSMEQLRRKERYCREFLDVIDVLESGLTRLRGLIMYELHAPILLITQRLAMSKQISQLDIQRNLKEVRHLLRESSIILKSEPSGSNEHQMGLAAEEALRKMS